MDGLVWGYDSYTKLVMPATEEDACGFAQLAPDIIYFFADLVPSGTEILHVEEETLNKVFYGIRAVTTLSDQEIRDCISEMQNRGILFRERSKTDV